MRNQVSLSPDHRRWIRPPLPKPYFRVRNSGWGTKLGHPKFHEIRSSETHLDACSEKSEAVPRKQLAPIEAPCLVKTAKRPFGGRGGPRTGREEAGPRIRPRHHEGPVGTAKRAPTTAPQAATRPRIFCGPSGGIVEIRSNLLTCRPCEGEKHFRRPGGLTDKLL